MSTRTQEPLDAFESRLLLELREVVTERSPATAPASAATPVLGPSPRRRLRRRWAIAGVAAATAGLTVWGLATPTANLAYAVEEDADGDVTFSLFDPAEVAGMEDALAEHGISADVTVLPLGMICADGRFPGENDHPDWLGPPDRGTEDRYSLYWTIPAGALAEGETLVLVYMGVLDQLEPGESAATSVAVADGPVGECEPIPIE